MTSGLLRFQTQLIAGKAEYAASLARVQILEAALADARKARAHDIAPWVAAEIDHEMERRKRALAAHEAAATGRVAALAQIGQHN